MLPHFLPISLSGRELPSIPSVKTFMGTDSCCYTQSLLTNQLPHFSKSTSTLSCLECLSTWCTVPYWVPNFCHACFLVFKARPFGLIKSLVLDSTVLRERHKYGIRRLYWLRHLVFHSNCSMARLKTLIKTKQLHSNCSW